MTVGFNKWLIVFSTIVSFLILGIYNGLLDLLLRYDQTYISIGLITVLILSSFLLGISVLLKQRDLLEKPLNFITTSFTAFGLFGTVVGLMVMLTSINLNGFNPEDTEAVKLLLVSMLQGAGIAFLTTASGLACRWLLRLQMFVVGMEEQ